LAEETQDNTELSSFIRNTPDSIDNATRETKYSLASKVDFELAVVTSKKVGGGLKIIVADIGSKYENEKLSKMKFSIGFKPASVIISDR